jgi:hypothetical protein
MENRSKFAKAEEPGKTTNFYSTILLALAVFTALPLGMIAAAVMEGKVFGTAYLVGIAQWLGVYEPLAALHKALEPIFGW